ncbi:MAG: hypothetical protein GX662_04710 [Trichococcus flocculiformis]|uniref:DUF262 domain-containing protein n=1 Tax=Trichococcus flocculiformis TaxID=82803 RepID=A0A847D578_9LACT|nr:hypothetical protein [Trichococcus flocculiformis]NLD31544.1 hypothetical protein [Trichococcus flocculiformis]
MKLIKECALIELSKTKKGMSQLRKISEIHDNRINADSIMIELTYKEYLQFANNMLANNSLQRSRVKNAKTVYKLLKDDIKRGCLFPPIVLAYINQNHNQTDIINLLSEINPGEEKENSLMILDGLQRTYTLIEAIDEMKQEDNSDKLEQMLNSQMRIEVYSGISKFGILYRMLTLNTGQTPMSLRHQIEILYSDYYDAHRDKEISLFLDKDDQKPITIGEYKFNEVVDGFTSFINGDPYPITKESLTDIIDGIKAYSSFSSDKDLFEEFVKTIHDTITQFQILSNLERNEKLTKDHPEVGEDFLDNPFGKDVYSIFAKSQSLTGFGAALSSLMNKKNLSSMSEYVEKLRILNSEGSSEWMINLLKDLDWIRLKAKKIGNGQRLYFWYFYRNIFLSSNNETLVEIVQNTRRVIETQIG